MKKELTTTQPATPIQDKAVLALVDTIRAEIEAGKERAYLAMEREKRQTYWNVGKHIKTHLLQNEDREDYASYVIAQLANELDLASTVLYESIRCYEQYPKIVNLNSQLTWSHIRVLTHIPETQARQELEAKVVAEKLTVTELKNLVKTGKKAAENSADPTLTVERGRPYTYQIRTLQKTAMIDLGFRFYIESPFEEAKKDSPKRGNIVQIEKIDENYQFVQAGKLEVPRYTYKAHVVEVIDGDTIWVNIDLGFNTWTAQKIRLRGINTNELTNENGLDAKAFIESRLDRCKFIVIKTYWRDKFTRYLADIFYKKRETDLSVVTEKGKFLNQELLDNGLAVKY